MKVIAICGSPRVNGNTEILLNETLKPLKAVGFDTDLISLAGKAINPCMACGKCAELKHCVMGKDDFQPIFEKMIEAKAIILGTPVYFGSATPQIMALIQRAGYIGRRLDENPFYRKVGAAVVVARRAGHNFTFGQLNYFFGISDMIVPGSTYWPVGFGGPKGDVKNDEEAINTVNHLGENIAWLLTKLYK